MYCTKDVIRKNAEICLTNHVGVHIMPLVIDSLARGWSHMHTHMHTCTHTYINILQRNGIYSLLVSVLNLFNMKEFLKEMILSKSTRNEKLILPLLTTSCKKVLSKKTHAVRMLK